jgi:cation transport ATPase
MARGKTTQLLIVGMRDNACRECIAGALESVAGVKDADVNFFRVRATVVHDAGCPPEVLLRAIARAGFTAALAPPRSAEPTTDARDLTPRKSPAWRGSDRLKRERAKSMNALESRNHNARKGDPTCRSSIPS